MLSKFESAAKLFAQNPSETNMAHLAKVASSSKPSSIEVALLAEFLANSGHRITQYHLSADIPSTGGPTSLSTLICPLYLRLAGFQVSKITVPGRPAGGIDVLAQIPGFKVTLSQTEIVEALKCSGYVHVLADEKYVPLDAQLFNYRKNTGNLAIPSLVIASILSKKLAAGVKHVGLDIRVGPHGNFGRTVEDARINAKLFIEASSELGIKSCCFLTDGRSPFQPYIGRGESLLALHILLEGGKHAGMRHHIKQCKTMAKKVIIMAGLENARYTQDNLRKAFNCNLVAQGSHYDSFLNQVNRIKNADQYNLITKNGGYPTVNMQELRAILTEYQNMYLQDSSSGTFADPCGLVLCYKIGADVCSGEVLARVRCEADIWTTLKKRLMRCFVMSKTQPPTSFFEEIDNA